MNPSPPSVAGQYVRHNDNKFDYDNEGIAHRKHINANQIRYIGNESNDIDDNLTGLEDPDNLEFTNDHEIVKSKEFFDWILSMRPSNILLIMIQKSDLMRMYDLCAYRG